MIMTNVNKLFMRKKSIKRNTKHVFIKNSFLSKMMLYIQQLYNIILHVDIVFISYLYM